MRACSFPARHSGIEYGLSLHGHPPKERMPVSTTGSLQRSQSTVCAMSMIPLITAAVHVHKCAPPLPLHSRQPCCSFRMPLKASRSKRDQSCNTAGPACAIWASKVSRTRENRAHLSEHDRCVCCVQAVYTPHLAHLQDSVWWSPLPHDHDLSCSPPPRVLLLNTNLLFRQVCGAYPT